MLIDNLTDAAHEYPAQLLMESCCG